MKKIFYFAWRVKMKKEYERAEIVVILTDSRDDIITTSGPTDSGNVNAPIGGGGGHKPGGWT